MSYLYALERIYAEYVEKPGLQLTPPQVQRLCGVDACVCRLMLDALVDAKFLSVAATGAYARATDDVVHSAPMASQRRLRLMKRPAPSPSRETSVRKLRKP